MPLSAAEVQRILTGEAVGSPGKLGPFSDFVLRDCTVVSCEPRKLVVHLPVTAQMTNAANNLHGGASCTLIDVLTTAALVVDDLRLSVTVDLHCTCDSGAPLGSTLEVESTVDHVGKSLLFTSCRIFARNDETGERALVATGLHTKKVIGTLAAEEPRSRL